MFVSTGPRIEPKTSYADSDVCIPTGRYPLCVHANRYPLYANWIVCGDISAQRGSHESISKIFRTQSSAVSSNSSVVRASGSGVGNLGLNPSRVKPTILKLILTASLLDDEHQRDSVRNKPASLLVVPLEKALSGIISHLGVVDGWLATPKRTCYKVLIAFSYRMNKLNTQIQKCKTLKSALKGITPHLNSQQKTGNSLHSSAAFLQQNKKSLTARFNVGDQSRNKTRKPMTSSDPKLLMLHVKVLHVT